MIQAQRIALVIMLIIVGCVLHILFFKWSMEYEPEGAKYIFSSLGCSHSEPDCLRIWYQNETLQNTLFSILAGILLPLLMICGAMYLYIGTSHFHELSARLMSK